MNKCILKNIIKGISDNIESINEFISGSGGRESTVDLTYPKGIWSPFYVVNRQKFDAWSEGSGSTDSEVVNDMILCNCLEISDLQLVGEDTFEGTFNGKKLTIGRWTDTDSGDIYLLGWYDIESPSGLSDANYYIKLSPLTIDPDVEQNVFGEAMYVYIAMTQPQPEPEPEQPLE